MLQMVQMIALCFSVLTAVASVVILVRAVRLLGRAKNRLRDTGLEGR